jgi:hypothetical protein
MNTVEQASNRLAIRNDGLEACPTAQFTDILADIAQDDHGIVRCALHFDQMRPLRDADIAQNTSLHRTASPSGFHAYEDAGMTTGAFLSAQSLRYRATGEPAARSLAGLAFDGIRYIYDLGRQKTEGFFPKPYDAQFSEQISRDQYLYVMAGLSNYAAIADDPTRREIAHMMGKMADYWIAINYRVGYFNLPAASHLDDFMGSLFLGTIRLAHTLTGEARFRKEYDRLFHQQRLGQRMGETLIAHFRNGGTYDGATYLRQSENAIALKSMAIDHLWDADPDHRPLWKHALEQFWNDDLLAPLDRRSGLNYFVVGYDARKDATFLIEPGVISQLHNPLNLSFLTWGGRRQSAGSAQTAYAAAVIARRLNRPDAAALAHDILKKTDLPKFLAWNVADAAHLPPGHEWEAHILRSSYLAYWLWTYWLNVTSV